jgi:hypothetical protein
MKGNEYMLVSHSGKAKIVTIDRPTLKEILNECGGSMDERSTFISRVQARMIEFYLEKNIGSCGPDDLTVELLELVDQGAFYVVPKFGNAD